ALTHYRRCSRVAPTPSPLLPRTGSYAASPGARRTCASHLRLLDLDGCSGLLELALDLVRFLLRDALLDRIRRAVHEILRFFQAEARHRADDLDHLDLLVAGAGQHDVEGGLLLLCGPVARCRSCSGSGHRDRCGRAHAPL